MKAIQAVFVVLVAAIILTSVAAAGPDAAKQRVVINMKIYPQKTFVLLPLDAGPLDADKGTISSNWTSIPGRDEFIREWDRAAGWRLAVRRALLR